MIFGIIYLRLFLVESSLIQVKASAPHCHSSKPASLPQNPSNTSPRQLPKTNATKPLLTPRRSINRRTASSSHLKKKKQDQQLQPRSKAVAGRAPPRRKASKERSVYTERKRRVREGAFSREQRSQAAGPQVPERERESQSGRESPAGEVARHTGVWASWCLISYSTARGACGNGSTRVRLNFPRANIRLFFFFSVRGDKCTSAASSAGSPAGQVGRRLLFFFFFWFHARCAWGSRMVLFGRALVNVL